MGRPEIRFKGYTDEWEQRKFSDCYKMNSGYAFKMSDYCDEGVGLINGESIQHGIINDDNLNHLPEAFIQQYPEFLLKEGDIVVGLNRPITNGNLKIARIPSKYNDSLLYQRAGKVVYKIDCDKDFTYVLLSQEILKHTLVEAVGSDQPFISTSKLDRWKMRIPSDMEEQIKIGKYFNSLDHLITLHQRKPIPHPNHPTTHTKHKGEEKYVRIRVNDREKIDRTANLRRFPVDIPRRFKDGGGSVGEFQIYSGAE